MRNRLFIIILLGWLFCPMPEALADWSTAQRLTWNSGDSHFPAMAIDSTDTIHVVWGDDTPGNGEIYYKRSSNGGTSWSAAQRITWTSSNSRLPAIAIDSIEIIHVVWEDDTPGNREIYYKRSEDGGNTWSTSQRITWTSGYSYSGAIAIDSSDAIHIAWEDETPGVAEIYYRQSPDGGATWSPVKRLTWTSGGSYMPEIAIDPSDTLHVVWYDNTDGNLEIYYKRSQDGGATWSPAKRLTWTSDTSSSPAMAIDSAHIIHIVWEDFTPGNWEIYYKKGN